MSTASPKSVTRNYLFVSALDLPLQAPPIENSIHLWYNRVGYQGVTAEMS